MAAYYASPQYYDSPASHASESLSSGASPPDDEDGSSYLPDEDDDDILHPSPHSHPIPAVDFDDPAISALPRILLMGPRRSGKTSIQRVVFHKMSPHETLFRLEATQLLERAVVDHTPLCRFTIWDFPGDQYETVANEHEKHAEGQRQGVEHDEIFAKATALIFVLDAQDEPYDHVLQSFTDTVTRAVRANPSIAIEVFVHKVDGELFLSDEAKYDCRRDVMQQVSDELADAGFMAHDAVPISYHLTSIYDHSVFEAFSRVVQRLIPELPTLEHLLNVLVSTCSMEKAYLFDVASKLYISTDSSPVDMQSVELCSDMIDVVLDVSGIYGTGGVGGGAKSGPGGKSSNANAGLPIDGNAVMEKALEHATDGNDLTLTNDNVNELGTPGNEATNAVNDDDELLGKLVGQASPTAEEDTINDTDAGGASAYDSESSSTIHLSNGMVLYLKEVDTMLALVCLTRAENFRKKSLINYNIGCLKKALKALPLKIQGGSVKI